MVSILMGLGHVRAANALRDIMRGSILIDGSKKLCSPREYKTWRRIRFLYYFMSKGGELPVLGKYILWLLYLVQDIPSLYPFRDLSQPTFGVKYLERQIRNKRLCNAIVEKIQREHAPVIHTFYASAIAVDHIISNKKDNYLLICDADINRIWVPRYPLKSAIKYLAPCTQIKKRLMVYGVPEENIFLTGFPLPKENIGSKENLEILKGDLFNRLRRLDPQNNFFKIQGRTMEFYLDQSPPWKPGHGRFTLTFAVGGSGAQTPMVRTILCSLKKKIADGHVRIYLSAGIHAEVCNKFLTYIEDLKLTQYLGDRIEIIYNDDVFSYLKRFNEILRTTDVLWTKPSELSFYCALGLPILTAPAVGTHEELNRKWLQDVHAGVKPAGPLEHTDEWLFDLRESGLLAEAAWDGFLKGRKLGTYKIEELIQSGTFTAGNSPLER
ncbi:MAG: hypothetical protein ABSH12_08425 [Endomicrobiales bacterium]